MKRFFAIFAILAATFLPTGSVMASGEEQITDFRSVAVLAQDGTMAITETITVNFGQSDHHGIYRDIPIVQRNGNDAYYYELKVGSISSSTGAPTSIANQGTQGDNYQIKIGNANTYVRGTQIYTISYSLKPFVVQNGDVDRVNMNVTGQSWAYPILHASLDLTVPAAPVGAPVCYTGITGSTDRNCTIANEATKVRAESTATLLPGSGMTVDMNLPGGSVTSYLVANKRPPLGASVIARIVLVLLLWLVCLLAIFGYAAKWLRNRRLKKSQTIYAIYEAPDGLTPGQIGTLVDSKSDMKEFTATIIDLAVRGYLKINQLDTKQFGIFGKTDYRFEKLKSADNLNVPEQAIYSMLFPSVPSDSTDPSITSTTMSDLASPSNATSNKATLSVVRTSHKQSLKAAGYYGAASDMDGSWLWTVAVVGAIFGSVGLVMGSIVGWIFFGAGALVISYAIARLKQYPLLTPEGAAEWAKVEGFKLYLSMAEKDRLNFSDAPERTPERFNKLLPYAVALGVEKEWAKQFTGIDISSASGWYVGTGGYMLASSDFAGSFASSFGSSVNSSFAGSSGAGGAGGGGGGGGGGGW